MVTAPTNLRVLKRSRTPPRAGDVFAMQLPGGEYLLGLVVRAAAPRAEAPMPGANLIYIFRDTASSPAPDLSTLRPARLLLPPIWTNDQPWTRGLFQNVAQVPLDAQRLLPKQCFWQVSRKRYVDERGAPVRDRVEPCGEWSLASYRWIDDHLSDALGIARAPEG